MVLFFGLNVKGIDKKIENDMLIWTHKIMSIIKNNNNNLFYKKKFIFDSMKYCLRNNIISEELSQHPIWKKLKIEIVDYNEKVYFPDMQGYWNFKFKFKKVILPKGWKMIAYGNDENQGENPQVIIIDYSIDPPFIRSQVLLFFKGIY